MGESTVAISVARFQRLLSAHATLSNKPVTHINSLATRLRNLLSAYKRVVFRSNRDDEQCAASLAQKNQILLNQFRISRDQYRLKQVETADDFNLLTVLNLVHKEIRHSMVLAWLLDGNIDKSGTHAQGSLGFEIFLKEFGLPVDYCNERYFVRREVPGDESIVDIEVLAPGSFLIHIENKIWSTEGQDQTIREWFDLKRRAFDYGINPLEEPSRVHAFYLTPNGEKPLSPDFTAISWRRIVKVLEEFSQRAKPPEVKLFSAHYARAIRQFVLDKNVE
ncbi:MAG: PD-(D/E)XK nuclease family protein [Burkholderiales bacterium]|nr:PD-(D/E)XK nuclease family protein [Phycisphaerae bacterium]